MKTRIVKTRIWNDGKFLQLNPSSRLVLIFLLTSPYVGMTNYFECADIFITASTGVKELSKIKEELESRRMAYFHEGWIFIPNLEKHNNYKGSPRNENVYDTEFSSIPKDVLEYFDSTMDSSIDSTMDSTHNTKTINNKPKIINQNSSNLEIGLEKKTEIANKYQVPIAFVESKYDDLVNYCRSKGKTYKDYEATLANWVKRDALQVIQKHNDKRSYANKYKLTEV